MSKKSKQKQSSFKISVDYVYVPYSRNNTVLLSIPCQTTDKRIQSYICGCLCDALIDVQESNPLHSALGAGLLMNLTEKIIILKNSKNKIIEMKHFIADGVLYISLILPPDASSLSQTINIVKKIISKKTAQRAYKCISALNKEYVKELSASVVQDMLKNMIMHDVCVTVYGKKEQSVIKPQIAKWIDKLTLPTIETDKSSGPKNMTLQAEELSHYQEIKGFKDLPHIIQGMIVVALQQMEVDSLIHGKQLYICNSYMRTDVIKQVEQLLNARLRFLSKDIKKGPELDKKLYSLVSFVHQQGAFPGNLTTSSNIDYVRKMDHKQIEHAVKLISKQK